jgi:hypothetical protein
MSDKIFLRKKGADCRKMWTAFGPELQLDGDMIAAMRLRQSGHIFAVPGEEYRVAWTVNSARLMQRSMRQWHLLCINIPMWLL